MWGGVSGLCRGCVVVVWGLFMFVFWIGSGLAGSWLGVVSAVVRGCLCFVRGCFGDVSGVLGVCLVGCVGVGGVWGLFGGVCRSCLGIVLGLVRGCWGGKTSGGCSRTSAFGFYDFKGALCFA